MYYNPLNFDEAAVVFCKQCTIVVLPVVISLRSIRCWGGGKSNFKKKSKQNFQFVESDAPCVYIEISCVPPSRTITFYNRPKSEIFDFFFFFSLR